MLDLTQESDASNDNILHNVEQAVQQPQPNLQNDENNNEILQDNLQNNLPENEIINENEEEMEISEEEELNLHEIKENLQESALLGKRNRLNQLLLN